jgi:hypothetical protein
MKRIGIRPDLKAYSADSEQRGFTVWERKGASRRVGGPRELGRENGSGGKGGRQEQWL